MAFQDVLAYHQPKQGYGNWQEIQIRTIFKISLTEAMHIGGCERILFHCSILRVPSLHAFDPFAKATTKAKKPNNSPENQKGHYFPRKSAIQQSIYVEISIEQ